MKGHHKVTVETDRMKYEFTIRRNITVILGDSATGKTTLVEFLNIYARRGTGSGVRVQSDVPCVVFTAMPGLWKQSLEAITQSIIFIDEGQPFIFSKEFAEAAQVSDNYYVLITRRPLYEIPYSTKEIYGIRTTGKYHFPEKVFQEFYPIYEDDDKNHTASKNHPALDGYLSTANRNEPRGDPPSSHMLHIQFGEMENVNYGPDWFKANYDPQWFKDPIVDRMIKDVDNSEYVDGLVINSPVLGPIPPERLSGGVQTLIMIYEKPQLIFDATSCGGNCAKWLLEIGRQKDITVYLNYLMKFEDTSDFKVYICNENREVGDIADYVNTAVKYV